jgi:hypothetical protein
MDLTEMHQSDESNASPLAPIVEAASSRSQPPRAPSAKIELLMQRAAAMLGIPEAQIVDLAKSSEHFSFRRKCVVYLLAEMGLDRTSLAGAFQRSASWINESISEVKERVDASRPFRLSVEGWVEDMRLASPVTQRFRSIRRALACHHGLASSGELTTTAALLTLADALAANDEADG